MKLLKYFLFLILVITIGGALFYGTKDGTFVVIETKVINAPSGLIYDQVKDFKNWGSWAPWLQIDPNIQISQSKKTEGEGAIYAWKSNHEALGNVSLETKKVIPLKEIQQEVSIQTLLGNSKSDVFWRFDKTETPGQTKVTWGVKGDPPFLEKILMSFREHDIGTGVGILFPQGLSNLDSLVRKKMTEHTINVDGITTYSPGFYLYAVSASKISDVGLKMAPLFEKVKNASDINSLKIKGKPFTIYNEMDTTNGTAIFSTCIPVDKKFTTPKGGSVLSGYLPEMTVLKTSMKGNYTYLSKAYDQANAYLTANGLQVAPDRKMFEVYRNDPSLVPNPAAWLTDIYIPIVPLETNQN